MSRRSVIRSCRSKAGVTLLELLIAVAMLVTGVMMITMMIPKVSRNITNNRNRTFANQFASTRLNELKILTYPAIPITPATDFNGTGIADCDCGRVDMFALPVIDSTTVNNGVLFIRKVCVNLSERNDALNTWEARCPDNPLSSATDVGLKFVRVQTSWVYGAYTSEVNTQSMVVNP